MTKKNLPRQPKHPPAAIADFAVGNGLKVRAERGAKHPNDLLSGVERYAADKK
jgi:hypothetical protein